MKGIFFLIFIVGNVLQITGCIQDYSTSRIYRKSYSLIYENDDSTRLMGLNSVYIVRKKCVDGNVEYAVRIVSDYEVDSSCFAYEMSETDLTCLKEFLDSCSLHKIEYGEEWVFERNGIDIFVKDCFLLSCYCIAHGNYVDMRVSPEKLKSILVKAETIIAEEKKKDKERW